MRLPPEKLDARQLLREFALLTWCGTCIGASAYATWALLGAVFQGGC